VQTPRNDHPRSIRTSRTRKVLIGSSIVLAGLSLGAGTAGAFPNGPVIIQDDDPLPPPPPPQPPQDFDNGQDDPQPPQGPQDWANPEPAPQPPVPLPGPDGNGGGDGGGDGGGEDADTGISAEDAEVFAAIAAAAAEQADAADEATQVEVDGTVGKEADRPVEDDEVVELAAGTDVAAEASSSLPALLAGLVAVLIAGAVALWLLVAKRRQDDDAVAA
jgi:hypothetical protein